ncbi:MAG: inositol-3-phosphate synthase [bacterium]|nr:inositol-3-phosphate synthase [bacterium]
MKKIKIAIVGVGNCASALIQGLEYYKGIKEDEVIGLMYNDLGGYRLEDIQVVAAFDIDKRKVGKDLRDAVFSQPNCTKIFCKNLPNFGVKVMMGNVLDGVAEHMKDYPHERTFVVANDTPCDVVKVLKDVGAEIVLNYLPVGSQLATEYYAQCAIDAGCAFVNNIPIFIASDETWQKRFEERGLPVVGDDIKSQLGATIVHRVLTKLFNDRGVKIDRTYQLNTGGNTDFLNMLNRERLASKKISKTRAVQSQLDIPLDPENIHIGPSDYVPWQKDNKVCFIRIEGRKFGDVPLELELRLSVEDSPNSAGVVIDVIRCCKLALDRRISGPLISISSYAMKYPPIQFSDFEAKKRVNDFIEGKTDR